MSEKTHKELSRLLILDENREGNVLQKHNLDCKYLYWEPYPAMFCIAKGGKLEEPSDDESVE